MPFTYGQFTHLWSVLVQLQRFHEFGGSGIDMNDMGFIIVMLIINIALIIILHTNYYGYPWIKGVLSHLHYQILAMGVVTGSVFCKFHGYDLRLYL